MIAGADQKIVAYLARREAQPGAASPPLLPLAERFQAMEERLAALARRLDETAQAVLQLQDHVDRGLGHLAALVASNKSQPASERSGAVAADWEKALLGGELAANPSLASPRQQLLSGVLEGNPAACALAGQLLLFRSAPPERLAPLLKDLGEAYYRWQPKTRPGNSPFEEALAAWLRRVCEQAGLHNTIELVHPGERFDASRHNATTRGVEITQVHGWIVLRDNGKVYTKATVTVR